MAESICIQKVIEISGDLNQKLSRLSGRSPLATITALLVPVILPTNDQANIKFYRDRSDHPKTFIRYLKAHFENMRSQLREAYSESCELTYVKTALKGYVQKWFVIHEQAINKFEDFERLFLKHFWGRGEQQKTLINFWNGRFEVNFGLTREKYATNKDFMLQLLDNPVEKVIVKQFSHHFDTSVIEKIYRDNVRIYDKFLEILRNFKILDDEKAGWSKANSK